MPDPLNERPELLREMSQPHTTRRWARMLPLAALTWLFLVGLVLLYLWPNLPKSKPQWVVFLLVAPPLYVLGEAFFGWLFSDEHGSAMSPRGFSVGRVLVALPVVCLVVLVCWLLSWLLTKL